MNDDSRVPDYTTYPKQFISYRWFKPILVAAIGVVIFFVLAAVDMFVGLVIDLNYGTGVMTTLPEGYDGFGVYGPAGAVLELGIIACILPALLLAVLIVHDRPLSSLSSSRGGWSFPVFFKCLGIAVVLIGIPSAIDSLVGEGVPSTIRFSIGGFIACTILGPLQCAAEEYLFRGFLMQTLGSWFKFPVIAIVLQAVAFTALHPYDLMGVVNIFVVGLLLGVAAWYTKGLEAGVALHAANNMAVFYMTGFGFGAVSSTVTVRSLVISLVSFTACLLVLMYMGKKRGWFSRVKKDDVTPFNTKVQAKRNAKTAKQVADAWHIAYSLEWLCSARSDAGVDHREDRDRCAYRIPANAILFNGAEPVGVGLLGHTFLFADPRTYWLGIEKSSEYVGGWGDVTETEYYVLTQGPAPAGARELQSQGVPHGA